MTFLTVPYFVIGYFLLSFLFNVIGCQYRGDRKAVRLSKRNSNGWAGRENDMLNVSDDVSLGWKLDGAGIHHC